MFLMILKDEDGAVLWKFDRKHPMNAWALDQAKNCRSINV